MEFILDHWYLIVAGVVVVACIIWAAYRFFGLPTKEQVGKVKEWLLYAVTEAERQLGGGTGQLKLRSVYDLFIQRFPSLTRVVSFALFSSWVDEALEVMRDMLEKNTAVKTLVEGGVEK